jgi:hypothetical protein
VVVFIEVGKYSLKLRLLLSASSVEEIADVAGTQ